MNIFRDRYIRVSIAGYMWDLGYFISQPLGAWLYNTGGFVLNFGTAVGIYAFACFIGVVRLWGFKEKINKSDLTIKGKINQSLPVFLKLPPSQCSCSVVEKNCLSVFSKIPLNHLNH